MHVRAEVKKLWFEKIAGTLIAYELTYVHFKVRFLFLLLLISFNCQAQNDGSHGLGKNDKPTISVLPLVYYTPETKWVFGAGAVGTFKLANDATYESLVTAGVAYSLRNQILTYASWRVFTPANKDLFIGEVGWYRYVYYFYGVGNDVAESDWESYSARYPRVRFDYARKIVPNLYLGIRYGFDNYDIYDLNPADQLINGGFTGSQGGIVSGVGPLIVYDSRDNQLYPLYGNYAELSFQQYGRYLGSDFNYGRLVIDLRKLFSVKENQVIATNFYSEFTSGGVPFFSLANMGGNKRMRGLFDGKYRDQNSVILQGEYRYKFLPRWGAVLFSGVGNVFSAENKFQFQSTKLTYGVGGRFQLSKKKKLNLRLDLAHSPGEDLQFYFTFGEAF
ncbi:BamA/TamA family outer membrane protein [Algoriphagus antarcticus]|uniref:Surface antigen-like protein n=1 Tax=Algoriphagus antarcticus TaxID=238540 RepID=A0A3E0DJJ8_9BACT|nr:BamA/TamA family outer membrane protein [Algoriphagus antarcticus]REG82799.1 surface antigen-like protein [Algoriphagus antarcticus]